MGNHCLAFSHIDGAVIRLAVSFGERNFHIDFAAGLTAEQIATLDRIKAFYGIERNSDALRFLIHQEARRIEAAHAAQAANPPASP